MWRIFKYVALITFHTYFFYFNPNKHNNYALNAVLRIYTTEVKITGALVTEARPDIKRISR